MTHAERTRTTEPVGSWLPVMLAELLGTPLEGIPLDRPLGELGIDSLTAAQLSAEIEERTGVVIPLERFLGLETLGGLVLMVGSGAGAAAGEEAEAC